jgi:hypothetical protein
MNTLKGYRLYVRLGASQTRRRLQGHGFGVRKVQSVGRGEAVIIHTATGQHRRELEALFQDVLAATAGEEEMSRPPAAEPPPAYPLE